MRAAIAALLAVLLVAGCVGQTRPFDENIGAPSAAAAPTDVDTAAISSDLTDLSTASSDLATPSVDLSLP